MVVGRAPLRLIRLCTVAICALALLFVFACSMVSDVTPGAASDWLKIAAVVNSKPGFSGTQVGLHYGPSNDGAVWKTLRITTQVNDATFQDKARLRELDSEIQRDAKRLYSDIANIDYIAVTFVSGYRFGFFSFSTAQGMTPMPPRLIPDS